MKRLTYILFLILFLIGLSCNTKKQITTTDKQEETSEKTETETIKDSLQKGLIIETKNNTSNLIEQSIITFDSITSISIAPDRSIQATGRNLRIINQRNEQVQITEDLHIDTTSHQKTQENISEEKSQAVKTTEVQKDVKRKVSFAVIQFGFIILIILGIVIWGLKKYFT